MRQAKSLRLHVLFIEVLLLACGDLNNLLLINLFGHFVILKTM